MPGSGKTVSAWMKTGELGLTAELREDVRADVCVVGAGIAGLSVAYLLAGAGRRVVVVDDGEIGGGETSRTTAHLSGIIDDRFSELERVRGREAAQLAAESHAAAIDRIQRTVIEEHIDCDFLRLDGYLFLAPGQPEEILVREEAAARRIGVEVVRVDRAPLDGFDTGPCLRFPSQAQCHPLRYLAALRRAVQRDGGRIFTGTRAVQIERGSPARVATARGPSVTADAIVVATNSPFNELFRLHTKLYPYRTYVIALRVPRGSVVPGLYWDTAEPYHYLRLQPLSEGEDLLLVGGEDHRTGRSDEPAQRYARLERWARERFPQASDVDSRWSGQILETLDGLAYIGRAPGERRNVFLVAGDSGMGMTHGTIAGLLLSDLVLGVDSVWTELYDPSRKPMGAARDFVVENLEVARQYLDWIGPADVRSPEQIGPGSGAVLRRGAHRIAAFRDRDGTLHELSAKCTHLQCVVQWNSAESTWDCPCHGSRFAPDGTVLNGPAAQPLAPFKRSDNRTK